MNCLFFLGQNQPLSLAELAAVYPQAKIKPTTPSVATLTFSEATDPLDRACHLGGTVKIARSVGPLTADLTSQITNLLLEYKAKNFSLSTLDSVDQTPLAKAVKQQLTNRHHPARFVTPRQSLLSPLIITKQSVTELIITPTDLYQTIWVHDFAAWITRDRRKPHIDPRSGMLPPKLARILINLSLNGRHPSALTLLDPFCGTGTILMEAQLLGLSVIGADHSPSQVAGSQRNLDWLPRDHFCAPRQPFALLVADATRIAGQLKQKVDLLVSEPYLGPPRFTDQQIPDLARGLQKLYLGALKNWRTILNPGAKVVLTLPQFIVGKKNISTTAFLDSHLPLGYNLLAQDLVFTRPGARLIRQIVILSKT